MKKLIAAIVMAIFSASAYADVGTTVTNYVYVVSNHYVHTYHENVITQRVKNTHYNYYYTNNLQDVVYQTQVNVTTNVSTTVLYDASQQAVSAANASASSASASALSASASADSAADSAEDATASASLANGYYRNTVSAGNNAVNSINNAKSSALAQIDQRQAWFDDNFGKMVTNVDVTVTVTTNIYHNEDTTARASAASAMARANAAYDLASSASSAASANATSISNLGRRVTSNETNIAVNTTAISNNYLVITNILSQVYMPDPDQNTYKYLLSGFHNSEFYIYINATNYTSSSGSISYYVSSGQTPAIRIERKSGVGDPPGLVTAQHDYVNGGQYLDGRMTVKAHFGSTSSTSFYYFDSTDKSFVKGVLPTQFSEYGQGKTLTFVGMDGPLIPISEWCLKMFQRK